MERSKTVTTEFINKHNINVEHRSHKSKRRFAWALSMDIGKQFSVFEQCHNSFYTNDHDTIDLNNALEVAKEFVQQIDLYEISAEKKTELEKLGVY